MYLFESFGPTFDKFNTNVDKNVAACSNRRTSVLTSSWAGNNCTGLYKAFVLFFFLSICKMLDFWYEFIIINSYTS